VVGSTDEVRRVTPARELALPVDASEITLLNHDLNIWDPAHVRVAPGDTVTWDVPLYEEGNYNRFRHDLILVDADGFVVDRAGLLRPFQGSDQFSFTFAEPGTYYAMCGMHSWPSEGTTDLEQVVGSWIEPGPYRCHSGSVTVEAP
jgi:plastocyanin